ncbi:MAG: hypothetical protein E6732_06850 [Enterococcus faecalis]|nr:hypothetical protein [Enterococcus faecalis]MDU5814263.1 hypothetical protein [Enterococcus casseliflavus]
MSHVNKRTDELAVDLVSAWLSHEAEVYQQIGGTSLQAQSISVKEVAQAYLDFVSTIVEGELPENLSDKTD